MIKGRYGEKNRKEAWEVMGTGPASQLAVVSGGENGDDRRNNNKAL